MPTITAYGTITNGKLTLANRKRFEADLTGFKDGAVEMVIRKKNRRSSQSNRYLWGVVYKEVEIRLRDLGNDVDSEIVHEFLKSKFLQVPVVGGDGEVIADRPGSTADLNKDQFTEYIENIMRWASEYLELYIPSPNEHLQFNF